MLYTGCFSYTSRLKCCLWQTSPTKPCPEFYGMFLLHIQTHMVPLENSHKPMPTTISTRCFSYTYRLKWCLQELLSQTSAQYAIYRMFLLHIQAEMMPTANISHKTMPRTLYGMFLLHIQAEMVTTGTSPTNQCPVCYIQDVSLTHPG